MSSREMAAPAGMKELARTIPVPSRLSAITITVPTMLVVISPIPSKVRGLGGRQFVRAIVNFIVPPVSNSQVRH
jgi:hypothetical protein